MILITMEFGIHLISAQIPLMVYLLTYKDVNYSTYHQVISSFQNLRAALVKIQF